MLTWPCPDPEKNKMDLGFGHHLSVMAKIELTKSPFIPLIIPSCYVLFIYPFKHCFVIFRSFGYFIDADLASCYLPSS